VCLRLRNVARRDAPAGPLRQRDGGRVTARVTSRGDTCESGPTDAIEDYSGESGLQYLGDGYWQFNWKSLKDYAGHCRTLKLTLSDGGTLTADFKFKK
jgi:hypothetical protein